MIPNTGDIIFYATRLMPDQFAFGLVEAIDTLGACMSSSDGSAAIISFNCIQYVIPLRFCPRELLAMFDMSKSRICKQSLEKHEVENAIRVAHTRAATCLQRAVIKWLYTPPTGAMYRRLVKSWATPANPT